MNESYIEEMENEGEALNQSLALNKVIINLLKQQRETNKRMFIALIVSILVNLAIVGGFLWYESQWEYTETKEITQEVSGNDSDINNVSGNQYKDSAIHNEGRRDKTWQQNKQLSTQEQENVKVRALKRVPLVDGFWAKNNGRWH